MHPSKSRNTAIYGLLYTTYLQNLPIVEVFWVDLESRTIFVRLKQVPTLRELSMAAAAFSLYYQDTLELEKDKLIDSYRIMLQGKVDQVRLTPHMKEQMMEAVPCQQCSKPCYEYSIKGLEISPTMTKPSKTFGCCSLECLQKDSRYQKTNLYYYSKFE